MKIIFFGEPHETKSYYERVKFGAKKESKTFDYDFINLARPRELKEAIIEAARFGGNIFVMCNTTLHLKAMQVQIELPAAKIIHIADTLGKHLLQKDLKKVLIFGKLEEVDEAFYKSSLENKYGIKAYIPLKADKGRIDKLLTKELSPIVKSSSTTWLSKYVAGRIARTKISAVINTCDELYEYNYSSSVRKIYAVEEHISEIIKHL